MILYPRYILAIFLLLSISWHTRLYTQNCSSGCTTTISGSDVSNYTIGAGQKMCINSGAIVMGNITLNGGEICNSGTLKPNTFVVNSGTINNFGTIIHKGTLLINSAATLISHTGSVVRVSCNYLVKTGAKSLFKPGAKLLVKPFSTVEVYTATPSICIGKQSTLTAFGADSYTWAPSAGLSATIGATVVASPTVTTTYTITGSSAASCMGGIATQVVTVSPSALANFSVPGTEIQAPSIDWAKTFGGLALSTLEGATSVIRTFDGGYIAAGYTSSNDGNVSGNNGGQDMWLVKLDANGSLTWQKCIGGLLQDEVANIMQTSDGGYVVGGVINGALSQFTKDFNLVKLDASGNIVWSKVFGGTDNDVMKKVKPTSDGGFIMIGNSPSLNTLSGPASGNHGGLDYLVIKTDANGNEEWEKYLGGTHNDYGEDVIQTTGGDYILTGFSQSKDGGLNSNGYDWWIVKLSGTGDFIWQKYYGGTGQEDLVGIVPASDKTGYFISGITSSTDGDVGPGAGEYLLFKINESGLIIWRTKVGLSSERDYYSHGLSSAVLMADPDGGCVVAGTQFDVNFVGRNAKLIKFNGTGVLQWQQEYGGGSTNEVIKGIQATPDGGYIFAGKSFTGIDSVANLSADFWVVKLAPVVGACVNSTLTFTNTSVGTGTYGWTVNGANAGSTANINYTFNSIGTYTVILTATNASCISSMKKLVTIVAKPTVTISPASATICTGSSVQFTASGASSYSWAPIAGLNIATGATVTASPLVTTTYTVTGTSLGCATTKLVVVTVNSSPAANAGLDKTICPVGSAVSIGVAAQSGYTYNWTPATGLSCTTCSNPSANPSVTTVYNVAVSAANCFYSSSDQVTVKIGNCNNSTAITKSWVNNGGLISSESDAVKATVSYTAISPAAVFVDLSKATNFNQTNFWSKNLAEKPSLTLSLYWDTNPETGLTDIDAGGDDKGSGTLTITYEVPVCNPIIHIDRLGGSGSISTGTNTGISNSIKLTLVTPGLSLTKLAGSSTSFEVNSSTIKRTPDATILLENEANTNPAQGNAAGSVQIMGLVSDVTFTWTGLGIEGAGGDAIELILEHCSHENVADCAHLNANAGEDKTIKSGESVEIGGLAQNGYIYNWSPATGLSCTNCSNPIASPNATTLYTLTVGSINCINTSSDGVLVKVGNCTNGNAYSGTWGQVVSATTYTVYSATSDGVNATVTFAGDANSTVNAYATNGAFANSAFWSRVLANQPSLTYTMVWDKVADAPTDRNIDLAGDDKGTGTMTITYNKPVKNPILHIDRLGGYGGRTNDPTWGTGATTGAISNSARFALLTPGLRLKKIAGTGSFDVSETSIQRIPYHLNDASTSEANAAWNVGTSAGSVQVISPDLITEIKFSWTGTGAEGTGGDGMELILEHCSLQVNNVDCSKLKAEAGIDKILCPGASSQIGAPAKLDYLYSWTPASGLSCVTCANPIANPATATAYKLSVSSLACPNTAADTVVVSLYGSPIAPIPSQEICFGSQVRLNATGGVKYNWSPSDGLSCTDCPNPLASPVTSTDYQVTITTVYGCIINQIASLVVTPVINVNAGLDNTVCSGITIALSASGADRYLWSPSDGLSCVNCPNPDVMVYRNMTYTLTGFKGDCVGQDQVNVNVSIENTIDFVYTQTGGNFSFTPNLPSLSEYTWSFGDGISATTANASRLYTKSGKYKVCLRVKDSCGQYIEKCKMIEIKAIDLDCETSN